MTPRLQSAGVTSIELARYLRRIRTTYEIPRLRAIAYELEAKFAEDYATLSLFRMIALKVVRIERTN
jgi:hypothetical protein